MKKVFFTYSDNAKDIELYKEFNKYFISYARSGLITIMDKDAVFVLNNDSTQLEELLKTTDITVPLLSIDYINSDECQRVLAAARAQQKTIVPVLMRDFDWTVSDTIKGMSALLLPEDKQSVVKHIEEGDRDEVFTSVAKKVKGIIFHELESVRIRSGPRTFYYIIAAIVMVIGLLATIYSYVYLKQTWIICGIIFLMFTGVALFALKNVLFPTKFRIG